ncbi:MAG: hypothetical protein KAR40_06235 [Candidatus Sabulitectum sp.]|nr:hypothetical protein [Candidatus Sabulitectum sp.]
MLDDLTLKQLAVIYNRIAATLEGVAKVSRFPSKGKAVAAVNRLLADAKETLIFVIEPDYQKRGKAAERFPLYEDGMLASEYVAKCVELGHKSSHAKHDIRYDAKKGLITVVGK